MKHNNYSAGDWVEIRSKEEILATLTKEGQLESLPFMPQMFQYCGQRFQVEKRAHKTCDTVFPVRSRRMAGAVHLGTRCDGQAYGGCEARCLLFWKEAWLKPVVADDQLRPSTGSKSQLVSEFSGCTEENVWAGTRASSQESDAEPTYRCQATQLPSATTELNWWNLGQYIEDYWSGNVTVGQLLKGAVFSAYYHLSIAGIGLGKLMRWFYDQFHWLWRGTSFPWHKGLLPQGASTPSHSLGLKPGELVRIKSHAEILKTLTIDRRNRGMYFDADMVPYCGQTFPVMARVHNILDEKTGKMNHIKNPAIILEGVYCKSRYSYCRMFCPRGIYSYWREIWLERVSNDGGK